MQRSWLKSAPSFVTQISAAANHSITDDAYRERLLGWSPASTKSFRSLPMACLWLASGLRQGSDTVIGDLLQLGGFESGLLLRTYLDSLPTSQSSICFCVCLTGRLLTHGHDGCLLIVMYIDIMMGSCRHARPEGRKAKTNRSAPHRDLCLLTFCLARCRARKPC